MHCVGFGEVAEGLPGANVNEELKPPHPIARFDGSEEFVGVDATVANFWRWVFSDCVPVTRQVALLSRALRQRKQSASRLSLLVQGGHPMGSHRARSQPSKRAPGAKDLAPALRPCRGPSEAAGDVCFHVRRGAARPLV